MSDERRDAGLDDAVNSIRSIGEDWESRDHSPHDNSDDPSDEKENEETDG